MADVEILGPRDRRRIWGGQEKASLLAEVDAEGGKVRLVALPHGISESLLYNWRSARKTAAIAAGAPEDITFVAVGVVEDKAPRRAALLAPPEPAPVPEFASAEGKAGLIEIILPGGTRIPELAEAARLSPTQFSRAFQAETGQSPAKAIENLRVEGARNLMELSRHPVDVVARQTGFSDRDHILFITPSQVADIIADDRIVGAAMTGSEGASAAIATQAATHLKKSTLQMGGNDVFIVLDDADMDMVGSCPSSASRCS